MHGVRKLCTPLSLALASLALAGCAVPPPQIAGPVTENALFAADLAANDGFVIGELHGTQEAPRAVVQMVAALPGRTLVAIEQSGEISELACDGDALPESWRQPNQDGRSSIAMRDMICDLRALEARGSIALIFIDDRSPTKPNYYDTAATRIAALMERGDFAQFVAFTGNFHSSNDEGFLPDLLRSSGLNVLSVTMSAPAGTAWNCGRGENGFECGTRETSFNACIVPEGVERAQPWGWQVFERNPQQWERCLMLPTMTASPPAAHQAGRQTSAH